MTVHPYFKHCMYCSILLFTVFYMQSFDTIKLVCVHVYCTDQIRLALCTLYSITLLCRKISDHSLTGAACRLL